MEYAYTTADNLSSIAPDKTHTYTYDNEWKDKLASYNGNAITYDEIGNPETYKGYTYTWQNGRELSGVSGNGLNASYKYNADGIRTSKTVDGKTTTYTLEGANVVYETNGTDSIWYNYDASGALVSMTYNGTTYYYVTNLQGDVVALTDSNGNVVVNYVYDSWGKLVSTTGSQKDTIGVINPYRYRSYRYDIETGLYYLQSRYYNPEMKRFINADIYVDTGNTTLSTNMFAYCENDSVNMVDPNGDVSKKTLSKFKKALRFFKKIIDSPLFSILLDIGLLIGGFTPAGMVLKAAIILGYIGRIAITIRSIRKACKTLKKHPTNADVAYAKVFGYITIVSCLIGIIATVVGAPKGTILKSVGRITIDAISKVLGTATSGYLILSDVTNYILKGRKPNRKKCVTYA